MTLANLGKNLFIDEKIFTLQAPNHKQNNWINRVNLSEQWLMWFSWLDVFCFEILF